MARTVRLSGFRETERALAQLSKSTGRAVLRRVLDQAAEPIANEAEANAPELTGFLQGSVGVAGRLTRRQASKQRRLGKSEVERHVGTTDPSGMMNEFGRTGQAAQPWLRPAWDGNKDQALQIIEERLGEEVDRASRRAARKAARAAG